MNGMGADLVPQLCRLNAMPGKQREHAIGPLVELSDEITDFEITDEEKNGMEAALASLPRSMTASNFAELLLGDDEQDVPLFI